LGEIHSTRIPFAFSAAVLLVLGTVPVEVYSSFKLSLTFSVNSGNVGRKKSSNTKSKNLENLHNSTVQNSANVTHATAHKACFEQ